jgi:hypothetical protein
MMPFMASVITTAGMPSKATPAPLQAPTSAPMPSVKARAGIARASLPSELVTIRIAPALSTHGTERSMPPMRMTKVCPAATSPTKEATVRIERTPSRLAKPGLTAWPITNSRMPARKA